MAFFPLHRMKTSLIEHGYLPEEAGEPPFKYSFSQLMYQGHVYQSGHRVGYYHRKCIFKKPTFVCEVHPCHPDYKKLAMAVAPYCKKIELVVPTNRRPTRMHIDQIDFDGIWLIGEPKNGKIKFAGPGIL